MVGLGLFKPFTTVTAVQQFAVKTLGNCLYLEWRKCWKNTWSALYTLQPHSY